MLYYNLATAVTCYMYSTLTLESKCTLIFLAELEGLITSSDTATDSSGRLGSGHVVTCRKALKNRTKRNP